MSRSCAAAPIRPSKAQHIDRQPSLRGSVGRSIEQRLVIPSMERLGIRAVTVAHLSCCSPENEASSARSRDHSTKGARRCSVRRRIADRSAEGGWRPLLRPSTLSDRSARHKQRRQPGSCSVAQGPTGLASIPLKPDPLQFPELPWRRGSSLTLRRNPRPTDDRRRGVRVAAGCMIADERG